jgi:hypothetical protein
MSVVPTKQFVKLLVNQEGWKLMPLREKSTSLMSKQFYNTHAHTKVIHVEMLELRTRSSQDCHARIEQFFTSRNVLE